MGYQVLKLTDTVSSASPSVVNQSTDSLRSNESDEEIIARLRERFSILDDMTRAVKKGDVRAMIVAGAPGVGKSYGVETILSKHGVFADIADDQKLRKYEIVKGTMSPIGLYQKLYEYSDNKSVLVLDDCDSVLVDDVALNILKAALDTSKKRVVSWNTESRVLRQEDLPNSFEFKGGVIFITNINFNNVRSKKLKDQLEALGLVTNALVLWNTIYMQAALEHLKSAGEIIHEEDEARLSPLSHKHVNILGQYSFTLTEQVTQGKLRPLKQPVEVEEYP